MNDPFSKLPDKLDGQNIRCQLMTERDILGLRTAAADPRIWDHMVFNASIPDEFDRYVDTLFSGFACKTHVPISIVHRKSGALIGAIKIMNISIPHETLSLGGTWVTPKYWGTGINVELHELMFNFCFDVLAANRIEIHIYTTNKRNIASMPKHGVKFEGILREARTTRQGIKKDVAIFSILAKEWLALCKSEF